MLKTCLMILAAAAPLAAADLGPFFEAGKIRALIISGRNNHDWRTTTPFLRKLLENTGRFDVRVVEEPAGLTLEAVMPFDVIVLDYNGPRWGPTAENAVGSAVRAGKGLVVVHGASYAFGELEVLGASHRRTGLKEPPWKDFFEMTGAAWTEDPKSGHGKRHVFQVKFMDLEHPVARGMAGSFAISDELYHNLRLKEGVQVLAAAYDDPAIGGTGKNEPMLWTLRFGNGRVFHTALGHDVAAMRSPGFVTTFCRGAEWAATGEVRLPALLHAEPAAKDPVRVQVVVGGHDFAPSFYKLFDGQEDIAANVVWQREAYTANRLKGAEVLVQYDMTQELGDEHRRNLRAFLESGHGLVVLHHAIASYQDWSWWSEEVVGGKYVLDAGENASTYQHDVELVTQTVADHPVTRGIPPMHIWDETYKKVWISPRVNVLIRTDHPTADGPLAWISPFTGSRVVYIELGHGPEAHNHPHYRQLVRNAILWAAGRAR